MIYLEPRDWLTSRKILRDLELFAKGSKKENLKDLLIVRRLMLSSSIDG